MAFDSTWKFSKPSIDIKVTKEVMIITLRGYVAHIFPCLQDVEQCNAMSGLKKAFWCFLPMKVGVKMFGNVE